MVVKVLKAFGFEGEKGCFETEAGSHMRVFFLLGEGECCHKGGYGSMPQLLISKKCMLTNLWLIFSTKIE